MDRRDAITLSQSADLSQFFREIVDETADLAELGIESPIKQYVVGLLEDSASGPSPLTHAVDRPLSLLLSEAMAAEPAERFQRLRQVGDGILLIGGLYRKHLQRSGLADRYVVAVGSRAYQSASAILELSSGGTFVGKDSPYDLLGTLAQAFGDLMHFLRAVADTIVAKAARSAHDVAKLCELWLSDRSAHLGKLLRARGVFLERTPIAH